MPDEKLIQGLIEAARKLIEPSSDGVTTGKQVAERLGMQPDDAALRDAFKIAARRGDLQCEDWEGGMGLPETIRLH